MFFFVVLSFIVCKVAVDCFPSMHSAVDSEDKETTTYIKVILVCQGSALGKIHLSPVL